MLDLEWFDLPARRRPAARCRVRLPFVRLGGTAGPTMVVLPGLSDGLLPLSEDRARDALRSFRPLPFQIRMVSYRDPLDDAVSTEELAADVVAFIDGHVGAPVVVTGHSMGGLVAQHVASTRPDLVTRLVLTATLAAPVTAFARRIERWDDLVARGHWRDFYRDAVAASYTGSELLKRRVALRVLGAKPVPHRVGRHHSLAQACLAHDSRDALSNITPPTLVMAGERDPVVPPAASRSLADALPDARFVVLDHASHGFPEQYPHRTYREVARFLDLDHDLSRRILEGDG